MRAQDGVDVMFGHLGAVRVPCAVLHGLWSEHEHSLVRRRARPTKQAPARTSSAPAMAKWSLWWEPVAGSSPGSYQLDVVGLVGGSVDDVVTGVGSVVLVEDVVVEDVVVLVLDEGIVVDEEADVGGDVAVVVLVGVGVVEV